MITYDLEAAAKFLHMSKAALSQKARNGEIKAAKPGRKWVFLKQDLVDFLDRLYRENQSKFDIGCINSEPWRYSNEEISGGLGSPHRMDKEYADLLGLKTSKEHKSITIT